MSRFFEDADTAKNYLRYRPGYSNEVVDTMISFLATKRAGPYELALDVGCGSGQLTRSLSTQFAQVIGLDISEAQIDAAHTVQNPQNVSFRVGRAENLPAADSSVDIITSATAGHYFNWDIFGKEVERVLKPNGCLVALYYDLFYIEHHDEGVAKKLAECIESHMDYITNSVLRKGTPDVCLTYRDWCKERLPLSYADQERIEMTMKKTMNLREFIEFHKTWAYFIKLHNEDPDATLAHFEKFEKSLMELLDGVDPETTRLDVWAPVFLRFARKP
ncbi:putative methyltransferase DDB_G0268948 [Strongylocentrotus purpuratus]|uniref:Methyltransferase type 11 domain-containing protein n=1 Tax=Strongylocentrotus purpuratus TaxID=7668 RepID=A0A7M7HJ01_STRPU|nr:putative methyltransferase DDB_G0268948 [Strongylocentrotus purpuratus]|eukprot:XP_011671897.1 PREDICTED: putative methyltransferase DDB_G0268948 [Strongylocentrotus purpuratus]